MALFWRRRSFDHAPLDQPFEINRNSVQSRGIVAWYPPIASRGTGVLRDLAKAATGALTNHATYMASGKMGAILSLDGTDDWVNIGDYNNITTLTLSSWIYSLSSTNYRAIIARRDDTGVQYTMFISNVDQVGFSYGKTSPAGLWDGVVGNSVIIENAWQHVAITWQQSNRAYAIYLNGLSDKTGTGTHNMYSASNIVLGIGRNPETTYPEYWPGYIGDTRIYSVALTDAEVYHSWAYPWSLYLPTSRIWALGEVTAGAVRILPQLATLGGQSVPGISPHVGGLL